MYHDGVEPGNPLRHDDGRHLEAVYWIILDWPAHVITRSFIWPIFALIRTSLVKKIAGGISAVMVRILLYFFGFFSRGISLPHPDGEFMFTAVFTGFLADLLSHKELTCWKGTGGKKACLVCQNLVNTKRGSRRLAPHEVDLSEWDSLRFVPFTDDELFKLVDDLNAMAPGISANRLQQLQTDIGFNAGSAGLMADPSVRHIYKPSKHHLIDFQHALVQDGVANTEVFLCLQALGNHGIGLDRLEAFCDVVRMPISAGKPRKDWFHTRHLTSTNIKNCSSPMLCIVDILYFFMMHVVDASALIPEEFACFQMLFHMLGLLRSGPANAAKFCDELRRLIRAHHKKFMETYGPEVAKPKLHALHHLIDHILWAGRLVSCFVTERKHRTIKGIACFVFRNFEMVVMKDAIHQQCLQLEQGHDMFKPSCLMFSQKRSVASVDQPVRTSTAAACHFGEAHAGDIIYMRSGHAGRVVAFWMMEGSEVVIEVDLFDCVGGDTTLRDSRTAQRAFVDHEAVADTVLHFQEDPAHYFRLLVPPCVLFF